MNFSTRESWQEYRRRMLEETSRFIEWGLRHPELTVEIPAKRVGTGGWPQRVAEWFWATALAEEDNSRLKRWKDALLRRPRNLLRR